MIQDDAVVCRNFGPAVEQIAERNPDLPVVLYIGGFPQGTARKFMRAYMRSERYVDMIRSPIIPLVAVLWPRHKAEEFLEWSHTGPNMTRADDGNAAKWMNATGQVIRVCVPSLVQHPDVEPPVKGAGKAHAGRDKLRVGLIIAENGLDYQW